MAIGFWGFCGFWFLLLLFVLNHLYMLLTLLLYEISVWKRLGPWHESYRPKFRSRGKGLALATDGFRRAWGMHK